ncbi:ankyrin repeat domain-containing protein [Streptomyces sp. NPDC006798]|uniref:ankyrin repeat domain-containing protein n=1 Tax=Streptomyces sp. NPDC006798 TaxID=3155462 RepID=UPI0033FFF859
MTRGRSARDRKLITAVYEGDRAAIARLLAAGASPEAADEDGGTALYLAAVLDGDEESVRLLLAAGADPERPSEDGDSPLCGAAVHGRTGVVRALLTAGARPDAPEPDGFTAMTWAVREGHAETVRALLEHGADPALPSRHGELPLVGAAVRGSAATVRILLEHGAPGRDAALTEARTWRERDVAAELRTVLTASYEGPLETVTRLEEGPDGTNVVVEVVRDGIPRAGASRGTGHAEIVALLETAPR